MKIASGVLQFGHQKADIAYGYIRTKDTEDGRVTSVFLSSAPLPVKALEDRQKLTALARKGYFLGLAADIDAEGNLQQSELYYDDGAFLGPWQFTPSKAQGRGLAGALATDGEGEFFGKPYSVDVKFKFSTPAAPEWKGSAFYEPKASGLAQGAAEGWMQRKGKKIHFAHAVVLRETDLFGDSGERSVVLTTKPVSPEMLGGRRGPEQALVEAGIHFLTARVNGAGEIESVMYPVENQQAMTFSSTEYSAEFSKRSGDEFDGKIEALGEQDEDSDFPRFQCSFHAAVRTIGSAAPVTEANGQPLPKDGGAPGNAFREFSKVLKNAKSIRELLPYRIPAMAGEVESIPAEHHQAMLAFLKEQGSSPVKVVGGYANADQATLWLEGKQDGETMRGRINLHLIDGQWRLGAESYRIGNLAAN